MQLLYSCRAFVGQSPYSHWEVAGQSKTNKWPHGGCVTLRGGHHKLWYNKWTSAKFCKIRFYLIFCHLWKPPLAATRPPSIMFSFHLKTRKRVSYLGAVAVELPFRCGAVAVQLPGICRAVTVQSLGSRWAVGQLKTNRWPHGGYVTLRGGHHKLRNNQ